MSGPTIESILRSRGAWFKGQPQDTVGASDRATVSKAIASQYPVFETLRDRILHNTDSYFRNVPVENPPLPEESLPLMRVLLDCGVAIITDKGHEICDAQGRKYLSGAWLEELAWLAAMTAGADEAVFGQVIGWQVKGFSGENEIDVIMRKGAALGFVSCKALRSMLDMHDRKHRNRLMDAVHEADNLADHFGRPGDRVAVLVSTDLIDEGRGQHRYSALMGKAAVLDVRMIPLEEMEFGKLTQALAGMWEEASEQDVEAAQ
ncbi:MAG: hypothetical protein U1E15_12560 [Hyphomicrobiales bacterium]